MFPQPWVGCNSGLTCEPASRGAEAFTPATARPTTRVHCSLASLYQVRRRIFLTTWDDLSRNWSPTQEGTDCWFNPESSPTVYLKGCWEETKHKFHKSKREIENQFNKWLFIKNHTGIETVSISGLSRATARCLKSLSPWAAEHSSRLGVFAALLLVSNKSKESFHEPSLPVPTKRATRRQGHHHTKANVQEQHLLYLKMHHF